MPDYPILQQNKPIGTLTVTQEGLFTVFSARVKTDADRLRLAVCGERSRAYLGLMLPDGALPGYGRCGNLPLRTP